MGWVAVSGVPVVFDVTETYLSGGHVHIVAVADARGCPAVTVRMRRCEINGRDGVPIMHVDLALWWDLLDNPGTVTVDFPLRVAVVTR